MFKHWYVAVCWALGLFFIACQVFGFSPIDPSDDASVKKEPGRTVRNNHSAHRGFYYTVFTGK
ncbi:MAG: hypothetical protein ACI376_03060 [Candidatus Bruticola sp.]